VVVPISGPHAGAYLHWWVVNISWTNLAIIGLMLLAFALALLLPFPGDRR
jgi:membrane protein YqaA with SNARE-associated domain